MVKLSKDISANRTSIFQSLIAEDIKNGLKDENPDNDGLTPVDNSSVLEDGQDDKPAEGKDDGKEEGAAPEASAEEPKADEGNAPADENGSDEWSELDSFKTADGEYDFTKEGDVDIVKVYKLLKNADTVVVRKDGDNIQISDKETGSDYIIQVGDEKKEEKTDEPANNEVTENKANDMAAKEKVYEVDLGYTTQYQKEDAMTTPEMKDTSVNAVDNAPGVPAGKERPYGNPEKKADPFTEEPAGKSEGAKPVEEGKEKGACEKCGKNPCQCNECGDAPVVDEGTVGHGGQAQGRSTTKTVQVGDEKKRNASKNGETGKTSVSPIAEAMRTRMNKILAENNALKESLTQFKDVLKETAAQTYALSQVVKLITENSTTKEEKNEIVSRFTNEAKTREDADKLYESFTNQLKKAQPIQEGLNKTVQTETPANLNETKVYESKQLLETLDLMRRVNRIK